eukprot:SAG25_NODE_13251_length_269_cov_0.905882_1_plen_31_part_01
MRTQDKYPAIVTALPLMHTVNGFTPVIIDRA